MNTLVRAHEITLNREGGQALFEKTSFTLNPGRLLHITGPNGIGKSTLIQRLVHLAKPDFGTLEYGFSRNQVGFLPQLHNMGFAIPLNLRNVLEMESSGKVSEETALQIGLMRKEFFRLMWNSASGGERQRTLMTRLLLSEPKLLILDEPFNHLDIEVKQSILNVLEEFLEADKGRGAIIVTHEENLDRHPIRDKTDLCSLREVGCG